MEENYAVQRFYVESEKRTSRENLIIYNMKKSLKKLTLNKKAVSSLTVKIQGGLRRQDDHPTNDPTANTGCFDCPPDTL